MRDDKKWDSRFLGLAKHVSTWSLDPSTKVGSVITDESNRIVSLGYNGFPRGVKDDERLYDRETKLKVIVHAERNCLLFAGKPLDNCIIYTWPFQPCSVCTGMIIQSGIKRVVSIASDNPRWKQDFEIASAMLEESGVKLELYNENQIQL
jgi:dCMP deaminase